MPKWGNINERRNQLHEVIRLSGMNLIIEAMAQCGGILALSSVPDPENYSTYFLKIDGVKFRDKVVPGDTLQFELKLAEPIRRGIVTMEAKAYVGNRFTTEAMLMAQIARNKD